MPKREDYQFEGFSAPGYTIVPDELFDELMAELTGNELKVLLYIVRRTFGWKKSSDAISIAQFSEGITRRDGTRLDKGAGVSPGGAVLAVKGLVAKGVILAVSQQDEDGGDAPTLYKLRFRGGSSEIEDPVSRNLTPPSSGVSDPRIQKPETQDTTVTRNKEQDNTRSRFPRKQNEGVENRAETDQYEEPAGPAPHYSAWIAQVIVDYSRELGDPANTATNVDRALRMWPQSGLGEQAFVELLQRAKVETRKAQARGVANKMARFFEAVESMIEQGGR